MNNIQIYKDIMYLLYIIYTCNYNIINLNYKSLFKLFSLVCHFIKKNFSRYYIIPTCLKYFRLLEDNNNL